MVERELSEPVDALALRARIHTLRIGAWPSAFACITLGAYAVWTWDQPHRIVLLLLSVLSLAASVALVGAPVQRLVRGRWSELFFVGWSASLVGLITLAAGLDGGVSSALAAAYFGPLAYSALCYPLKSMLVVAAIDVAAFLGLAVVGGQAGAPYVLVFAGSLIAVAWICAGQALNLDNQRRELARVSRTDPLTGALNRRGFEERLAIDLAHGRRHARPVALVLLDLDHFKLVNDSDGHAAGDDLLRWVVSTLQGQLRRPDSLGRLGGDEFAFVVHEEPAAARVAVDRLLGALAARTGVSAGVAVYPVDGLEAEELHHVADLELYEAKQGTRFVRPAERELSWAAALASCVDQRMAVGHEHSRAVAEYAAAIAQGLHWTEADLGLLRLAATLHDVGKIHVPVDILRKPGPLDGAQFAAIAEHPAAGAEIVGRVEGLDVVAGWIRHCHERIDGRGYPEGLVGEEIPLASRILLVADAYDAMTSDRPYRRALMPAAALDELRANAGSQFDAECVALLEAHLAGTGALAGAARPA